MQADLLTTELLREDGTSLDGDVIPLLDYRKENSTGSATLDAIMAAARARNAPRFIASSIKGNGQTDQDFEDRASAAIFKTQRMISQAQAQLDLTEQVSQTSGVTSLECREQADTEDWDVGYRKANRLAKRASTQNEKTLSDLHQTIDEYPDNDLSVTQLIQALESTQYSATGWSIYMPAEVNAWTMRSRQPWREYREEQALAKIIEVKESDDYAARAEKRRPSDEEYVQALGDICRPDQEQVEQLWAAKYATKGQIGLRNGK